ncbi:hypothetical protein [Rhodococcus sp. IEGM 1330]|uniref:hypothetical protein n=1 Tax=Rhodococcus sp. IEGM 1330 TaxID=3082225 RepID=UPI00295543D9|nr:hypothetical protein [Rhodococcus sp. IEGM 1330]MDV8024973.1 hypothetical protein [Rhodococcus sp. IEGM 1330]
MSATPSAPSSTPRTRARKKPVKPPLPRTLPARLRADPVALTATRNTNGQIELSIQHSPITFVLEHRDALELADAIVDATEQRRKRRRRRRHPTTHATPETP